MTKGTAPDGPHIQVPPTGYCSRRTATSTDVLARENAREGTGDAGAENCVEVADPDAAVQLIRGTSGAQSG